MNCEGEQNSGSDGKGRVSQKYREVLERWKKAILLQEDAIKLLSALGPQTKPNSCETVLIGILPKDIHLHLSNGQHHLFAYCQYMVEHWNSIKNVKPALDPPPTNCHFTEGLSKTPAEILAQDMAEWIVNVEYIHE
jgi:hypothetical protein